MKDSIFIGRNATLFEIDNAIRFLNSSLIIIIDEIPRNFPLPIEHYGSVMTYEILFGHDDLKVYFVNPQDYEECAGSLPQKHKAVIMEKPLLSSADTEMLKTAEIFLADKGKIRKAKNAELQQFIR